MEFEDFFGNKHIKPMNKIPKKRISVYGLFIKDNKILMIKSAIHSLWELPGGGVDPGETELDALKREFIEESGYLPRDINLKPFQIFKNNFYAPNVDKYFYNEMKFFLAKSIVKKENPKINPLEIEEIEFINFNKINELKFQQYHLKAIKKISQLDF